MDYTEKERRLVEKISRLIRQSKVEAASVVTVLTAQAARLAVRAHTHSCDDFQGMAHAMFHNAEEVVAMVDNQILHGVGGLRN